MGEGYTQNAIVQASEEEEVQAPEEEEVKAAVAVPEVEPECNKDPINTQKQIGQTHVVLSIVF